MSPSPRLPAAYRALHAAQARHRLDLSMLLALLALQAGGGRRTLPRGLAALGREMGVGRSTLGRTLGRLAAAGLLRQARGGGRALSLSLTPAGRRLAARLVPTEGAHS